MKPKITGVHHIALKAVNFEESLKFFTEGLGMKFYTQWGEGDGRIAMLDLGDGGRLEMFADGSDEFSPNGKWVHFAMKVTDTVAVTVLI